MSLTATLSNALSGMSIAQRALGVTTHNVANANTEGYTRKVARQEAVAIDGKGSGARALEPERIVDEFLEAELRQQQSRLRRSEALVRYHDRTQGTLFGAPGDASRGIANRISRLATAAEALANTPEKGALRVAFVGAAQDLVRQVADDAARVQLLRGDADREIARTVEEINGEIRALDQLNAEVARSRAPAELLDRRDQLLSSLSEKLPISVVRQEAGRIAVYMRGSQALLEYGANQLDYRPAAQVGFATSFGPIRLFRSGELDPASGAPLGGAEGIVLVSAGIRAKPTPELAADDTPDTGQIISSPFESGRLQGLIEARDRLLPELGDQLGELAGLAGFAINAAHNGAVPYPPPASLVGSRTSFAGWAASANSGTAYIAVIDRATGATVRSLAVSPAGAASPADVVSQINAGLAGLGSASLAAGGALQITLSDAGQGLALDEGDSRIEVADAAGRVRGYGLAHYFGLNDLIVSGGANPTDLTVRPDILADSSRLSAVALGVEAGPPLIAQAGGAGDGRPARGLAGALQQGLDTIARGALHARRATRDARRSASTRPISWRSTPPTPIKLETPKPPTVPSSTTSHSAAAASQASTSTRSSRASCSTNKPTRSRRGSSRSRTSSSTTCSRSRAEEGEQHADPHRRHGPIGPRSRHAPVDER